MDDEQTPAAASRGATQETLDAAAPRVATQRSMEDQFRLLVANVQEYAIFLLDKGGNIASWNAGAQRIKGYTADEIIGRHFSVFYLPEDIARNHPREELEIAARVGRYEEEGWRVRRDGSRFWANVVITALYDADGTLSGFGKITRDMSDRKAAEEARLLRMRDQISRAFLRDVLYSVTEGKLRFCEDAGDLPTPGPACTPPISFRLTTLPTVRRRIETVGSRLGYPRTRLDDLLTAVGEGSMNAVVHARDASFRVCGDKETSIQIWISDRGTGIELANLHRATLERGYTTEGTLGHGFWLMLHTCDRIWLLSTSEGTTLVLEQDRQPPEPEWLTRRRERPVQKAADAAADPSLDAGTRDRSPQYCRS